MNYVEGGGGGGGGATKWDLLKLYLTISLTGKVLPIVFT